MFIQGCTQTDTEVHEHTHLNLKFSDLLPEFSHRSHTVSFPQSHCHHLLFTLHASQGGKKHIDRKKKKKVKQYFLGNK